MEKKKEIGKGKTIAVLTLLILLIGALVYSHLEIEELKTKVNILNVTLNAEIDSLKTDNKKLLNANEQLNSRINTLSQDVKVLNIIKDSLAKEVQEFSVENKKLKGKVSKYEAKIEDLKKRINILGRQIVDYRFEISNTTKNNSYKTSTNIFASNTKVMIIYFRIADEKLKFDVELQLRKDNGPLQFYPGSIKREKEGQIVIDNLSKGNYKAQIMDFNGEKILAGEIQFEVL